MDDMSYEMADEYGIKKEKKGHGFLIFFISLIIGVILGGTSVGYYLVEIDNPFEKQEKVVKKEKEETKSIELDNESYIVETLVNRLHTNIAPDLEMELYASDNLKAEDLESAYVNYLTVNEVQRQIVGISDDELTIDNMKKALNTLFGDTNSFVAPEESFGECPEYKYDAEEKIFKKSTTKCEVNKDKTLERTVTKATLTDKKIEIYEAVAFFDNKENKVYKKIDANRELSNEVKNFDTSNFLIKRDYNKVNTYKYTFTYDESTSNYIFESLSLEK